MTTHLIQHRAEILRLASAVRLTRADCGKINEQRRTLSLKALPPPTIQLTDNDVRRVLEPRAIKWPKDLIPDYRSTPIVSETIPYYRFSTDKQEFSIDHQRHACEEWYELRHDLFHLPPLTAKEFADPETSGSKRLFERKGGGQFGQYVRPGDHIVFAYFDRMGRDALDALSCLDAFVRLGVFVHILDHAQFQFCDPRHPSTIRDIQSAAIAAENERRLTSDRTRRAHRTRLANNVAMGGAAGIGYKKIPNPAWVPGVKDWRNNPRFTTVFSAFEAAICEEVYRLWLVEAWSAYEIVKALRNRGKKDKRFRVFETGLVWDKERVKYVLRKLHAERSSAGAAGGYFQTAALNNLGGAN